MYAYSWVMLHKIVCKQLAYLFLKIAKGCTMNEDNYRCLPLFLLRYLNISCCIFSVFVVPVTINLVSNLTIQLTYVYFLKTCQYMLVGFLFTSLRFYANGIALKCKL